MTGEATWRPALSIQTAFNANPNDISYIPIWSDLSSLWLGADGVNRGRQYELDQNQAAQPTMAWVDPSEILNPANTSGLYYPFVLPLRQVIWQATWPNPVAGNLMNTNQPASSVLGTTSDGYDPTFESYTVGDLIAWLTASAGTDPVVSTTTPFQGTQDASMPISGSVLNQQGMSWNIPTVPGVQYTVSAYARQNAANTLAISVGELSDLVDGFNRTVVTGWGTPDVGGAYTLVGGTSAEFYVTSGFGHVAPVAVASVRAALAGGAYTTVDSTGFVSVDQVSTGGAQRAALLARYVDASNYYYAALDFNTDRTLAVSLVVRVAGVETILDSTTLPGVYSPGETFGIRFVMKDGFQTVTYWRASELQPVGSANQLFALNNSMPTAGQVGTYSRLQTGNTNVAPTFSWSILGAYARVVGSSTTTSGSYVRLTQTFTASQPVHSVQVNAASNSSAATLLLDALQLEVGSSATTFTATGSTIYPVFRGYIERWPSAWANQGFLGLCETTAVDAFEPLNLGTLDTALTDAILAQHPLYYWRLNEPSGSTLFGEGSGNSGPPLGIVSSRTGGAGAVTPGSPSDILGDPGETGVELIGTPPAGSALQNAAAAAFPFSVGASAAPWAVSVAFWFVFDATNVGDLLSIFNYASSSTNNPALVITNAGAGNVRISISSAGSTVSTSAATTLFDGNAHLVVGMWGFTSATAGDYTLYVDDTAIASNSFNPTASFGAANLNFVMPIIQVGAWMGIFAPAYDGQTGIYAQVAVWDEELDGIDVNRLSVAGTLANSGQFVPDRLIEYISSVYSGPLNISTLDFSQLGPSQVTPGTPVLAGCQDIATTEQGNFWVDKEGVVTYAPREDRYLTTSSSWTFGENTTGGEYPYQESIQYDYDPTFIYNSVSVSNSDGVTVQVTIGSSQRKYFVRSYSLDANLYSDEDAIQLANWIANTHAEPTQRIASITLDPAAYPLLWPVVLSMEIGDRVTVVRRPKAANGGAGITMTGDFFIEAISHDGVDMAAGAWLTTLLLSPAALTSNVFRFNDATYGTFDGPGVLAY